ncbi:response regulator transcription factor [Roseomonas populi]|uniref:Response regulator transcription factor n=1 Tax=Roseomonas populi TaxID=3121582 RepID=A0ABT1X8K2_9PROT|nr:response regulator transcription factor [Roseomonas pecuniae]MCR0984443.1 response regulator transcription factor [Roseomonas pecuniae]
MPRVLIVDDDPAIRDVVRFALSRAGYGTLEAADGAAGLAAAREALPDLIVLDVMLPEMDGTEMCRALRASGGAASAIPVLFLSSRDDEVDRVVGLEIGGDDYLTKPFSPRELVARVRAVLRRGAPAAPAPADEALRHGRLALDPGTARVTWDGAEVVLTATEFGLLRTLMRRPGRVLNRDALMDGAYTVERVVSDRTIDSHVRRLRAKFAALGAAPVETLPGFGYRLGPCD